MTQHEDEPVRSFGARLQGQAGICKFLIKCTNCNQDVNYTEAVVRDVLSKGLYDADVQLELLGHEHQDMSLEEVFHFVEAKELCKRSATRLLDAVNNASLGADSASSSCRRARRECTGNTNQPKVTMSNQPKVTDPATSDVCIYCGNKGHGSRAPARFRRLHCPAYDKVCKNCKIKHHLDTMCRAKSRKPSQ